MNIKDFIPPIMMGMLRRLKRVNYGLQPTTYSSYNDALLACNTDGYHDDYLTSLVYEKTKRFRDHVYSQRFL